MSMTEKTDSVWFTTKGQVVIPAWLRRQFNIEDGTKATSGNSTGPERPTPTNWRASFGKTTD
jgi:hypothetical protein